MTDITILALRALSEMAALHEADSDLVWGAADEIERLRADNERLLQVMRRSLPKRPGALGDIDNEAAVDDATHPVLLGELGEIAEMETTFVDTKGEARRD